MQRSRSNNDDTFYYASTQWQRQQWQCKEVWHHDNITRLHQIPIIFTEIVCMNGPKRYNHLLNDVRVKVQTRLLICDLLTNQLFLRSKVYKRFSIALYQKRSYLLISQVASLWTQLLIVMTIVIY